MPREKLGLPLVLVIIHGYQLTYYGKVNNECACSSL